MVPVWCQERLSVCPEVTDAVLRVWLHELGLEEGTAPEEGDTLGEQTAGPGAAMGSVYPAGH